MRCVGDIGYNVQRSATKVEILGITYDDKLVLRFLEGTLRNRVGGKWDTKDVATSNVCGASFCPGDIVYNKVRQYTQVEILAVDKDGKYVIKFLEGTLRNRTGHGWSGNDLAPVAGARTVGEERRERLERMRRGRRN